jgi:ribosomal protein L40E
MAEAHAPRTVGSDERALGRAISLGLPLLAGAAAAGIGVLSGLGPAILVLASGALLGTIALFWASVRTLSGEAPLPDGMTAAAVRRSAAGTAASERKRAALRALKDLELEHAVGKIDDDDYETLVRSYRELAKTAMRELDEGIDPLRARAEEIVKNYLAKRRVVASEGDVEAGSPKSPPALSISRGDETMKSAEAYPPTERVACAACGAANAASAAFCKKCGNDIRPRCPHCGTSNDADATFCDKCGTSLSGREDDADVSA